MFESHERANSTSRQAGLIRRRPKLLTEDNVEVKDRETAGGGEAQEIPHPTNPSRFPILV